ncbi:MAG: AAA family ATPase [Elusimicrobiota bacterium]|jgi:energy-coupling factor transporter ATP-binding protein EcfA2|nr:AAA family ATPase [Elusimicrobiota bacterium]
MPIKINNLLISGIRGIQTSLNIPLNEKSILLYGENGSGKSSIADAIEWLYKNDVSHLTGEEVNLQEAMRNSYIEKNINSEVSIAYHSNLNISKKLFYKGVKLTSEMSDGADEYINASKTENLLIRYHLLREFVSQRKSDKLKFLSDIIGFSEVTKVKDILKKVFNSVKNEIKMQNFENLIISQKETLVSKIGAVVSQEDKFVEKINEIIRPLEINEDAKTIEDIDNILATIKEHSNEKQIISKNFLEIIKKLLDTLKSEIDLIDIEYRNFFEEYNKIAVDTKTIMQTFLSELLIAGNTVIEKKYHKDNICPLCLQEKNLSNLNVEIKQRLKEINKSMHLKDKFENAKRLVFSISSERIKRIEDVLNNTAICEPNNIKIKQALENLKIKFQNYQYETEKKILADNMLLKPETLSVTNEDFEIQADISHKLEIVNNLIKNDKRTEVFSNISAAKDAFLKIKKIENEKTKLEHQKKSLELIYNEFTKQQKLGLEEFINHFSSLINDFYQYMNPDEPFQEIRIITIGEDDGLKGITIEYKYNNEWVAPPQKYFSESHLNCFGIAFFLASVVAFNKENKFIVLDDVISSFDTSHRIRFANLLFDKFKDYQIILLTHETEWFNYVSALAKKNAWLIDALKWSKTKGTYIDNNPTELKVLIEKELSSGSGVVLANSMRQYLEHFLKEICFNIEAEVKFKFNDVNEKRMLNELMDSLKSRINKKGKSNWAEELKIIDALSNSSVLSNLLSHDNTFSPKMGDLQAFWADIQNLEKIFVCQDKNCKKPKVSVKNYDSVNNKIRCGCGKTEYYWKNS